jgi:hypothetical protein
MDEQPELIRYLTLLTAGLARDLDEAGLLSDATRKIILAGVGEIRGSGEPEEGLGPALRILDGITPAPDG